MFLFTLRFLFCATCIELTKTPTRVIWIRWCEPKRQNHQPIMSNKTLFTFLISKINHSFYLLFSNFSINTNEWISFFPRPGGWNPRLFELVEQTKKSARVFFYLSNCRRSQRWARVFQILEFLSVLLPFLLKGASPQLSPATENFLWRLWSNHGPTRHLQHFYFIDGALLTFFLVIRYHNTTFGDMTNYAALFQRFCLALHSCISLGVKYWAQYRKHTCQVLILPTLSRILL